MEIIYRANDGEEFCDENLCREYERKKEMESNYLRRISPETIFVTGDFRRIPTDEFYDRWDDIFGMYFSDNESAMAVQQCLEDNDDWDDRWPNLYGGTPYWWDKEKETWADLDEVRDNITEKIDRICSAK